MSSPPMIAHSVLVQTPTQILTRRTTAIHRVEGGNGGNLGAGQTQLGTAEIDPGRGDVPVLGLHEMKERQEG